MRRQSLVKKVRPRAILAMLITAGCSSGSDGSGPLTRSDGATTTGTSTVTSTSVATTGGGAGSAGFGGGTYGGAGPGAGASGGAGGDGGADDAGGAAGGTSDGGVEADASDVDAARSCDAATGAKMDWGRLVVDSTMKRFPDVNVAPMGAWSYQPALFLHGAYLVYKRTRDPRYLAYIKAWVDSRVDANGAIDDTFSWLDDIMPGNVILDVHQETPATKYKTAIDRIRKRFDTLPRTSDGAFWHNTGATGQTWGDGVFMSCPFLSRYGQLFGDAAYANDETTKQLLAYHDHLKHPTNGTHYHAWDEQGDAPWTTPAVKHSAESWCRAIGWYSMATIEVLELLPASHPSRAPLVSVLQGLVEGVTKHQHPATGRWFQVIDKGSDSGNWLETSCSAMLAYTLSRAVERGYVASTFSTAADKGYAGVLQTLTVRPDGLTNITDISTGTSVGDLAYYYGRPRATNDFHGLGAVLIMLEQFAKGCP
jgi:unsaturated rhamnogalacturonyl hydrolase